MRRNATGGVDRLESHGGAVRERRSCERLAALHERDEFFWIDLATRDEVLETSATSSPPPVAMEDTRRVRPAAELDVYGDHVLLVFFTVRRDGPGRGGLGRRGPRLLSGDFVDGPAVDVPEPTPCTTSSCPTDAEPERYIVYRILDVLTDAFYPIIASLEGGSTRSSAWCC